MSHPIPSVPGTCQAFERQSALSQTCNCCSPAASYQQQQWPKTQRWESQKRNTSPFLAPPALRPVEARFRRIVNHPNETERGTQDGEKRLRGKHEQKWRVGRDDWHDTACLTMTWINKRRLSVMTFFALLLGSVRAKSTIGQLSIMLSEAKPVCWTKTELDSRNVIGGNLMTNADQCSRFNMMVSVSSVEKTGLFLATLKLL